MGEMQETIYGRKKRKMFTKNEKGDNDYEIYKNAWLRK